ncbi:MULTISPECIES: ABC transporter permease [unclassified Microcella]|uniref:ABC transporter permease n=1 Tax=unclassified Microcella TaxID=2630066 RepID=UPI000700C878|nr:MULTISPECIES: ABC transporter permease [unclassified Microcella]KQV25574.1 ABC transporter permease [Yonghaparkia sp. Root332]KRF33616.1 ABC transporter permease [Yonghaparkia sp. Soil809]
MADTSMPRSLTSARVSISKGLLTVAISLVVLVVVSAILAPSSVSPGAVLGMLPFAAVLAIVGLGQMLVVQQGGIDLSVPGGVSLAVVLVTHMPNENDALLVPAVLAAFAWAIGAGLLNGFMVGRLGLNPIIATLGTNALLFGAVLGISGGIPRTTTRLLASIGGGQTLGIPHAVLFALGALILVSILVKRTVAGRRFEAVGASPAAARATGLRYRTHQGAAYVWSQLLFATAGILLAGITNQPTAFQGNTYLLTSVAVVVLGGTSLLGGRGFPVATVVAALFLSQLDQFVLALGVPFAVRTLVQAAALAIGVAIYTVNWAALRQRFARASAPAAIATP